MATHLKGLARKAKLNKGHAKAAWVYKARVASLTSERTELRDRVQGMTEEAETLKYDLKHTMSARARPEGREDEVRNSLTEAEGKLREVRDELRVAQNDLTEARNGLQLLNMSFRWLGMSSLHPRASCGSLKKICVQSKRTCVVRRRCWMGLVARPSRLPARPKA